MRRNYPGQFEPWRPFYMVIPTNEYVLGVLKSDSGKILASAIVVNRFIRRMTGEIK